MSTKVYTIGHSKHPFVKFIRLLKKHGITAVGDVRSVPYSRFNPQFNRENLVASLKKEGITYIFLGKELGAKPEDTTGYKNGKVDFNLIAKSKQFKHGLNRVIASAEKYRIALMCAEKEPLNCHRTILVCRNLKAHGVQIKHILEDGTVEVHDKSEARLLKLTDYECNLFTYNMSDMDILDQAYNKRGNEIAFQSGSKRDKS